MDYDDWLWKQCEDYMSKNDKCEECNEYIDECTCNIDDDFGDYLYEQEKDKKLYQSCYAHELINRRPQC